MVRTYEEVPKRARNSIRIQVGNLIKKYGEKEVRLVTMKVFEKSAKQRKLEEEIKSREQELEKLKKQAKK